MNNKQFEEWEDYTESPLEKFFGWLSDSISETVIVWVFVIAIIIGCGALYLGGIYWLTHHDHGLDGQHIEHKQKDEL